MAKGKFYERLYLFNLICHLYWFHLFHNFGFLPMLMYIQANMMEKISNRN